MDNVTHVVDPDGDIILLLKNPNAALVPFDADETNSTHGESTIDSGSNFEDSALHSSSPVWTERRLGASSAEIPEVQMLLSSKHLAMASDYFKTMLQGPWREAYVGNQTFGLVTAEDWDVEALYSLMNIVHGRVGMVPRVVNLEFLASFAVIVDYYQCYQVVEAYADLWQKKLQVQRVPSSGFVDDAYNVEYRKLILQFHVSWVFANYNNFRVAINEYLRHGDRPLLAMGLPIPGQVTEFIGKRRNMAIGQILDVIFEVQRSLAERRTGCAQECDMILLGTLTKFIWDNGLCPKISPPYSGLRVAGLCSAICDIQEPSWYDSLSYDQAWHIAFGEGQNDGEPAHECDRHCKATGLIESRHRCTLGSHLRPKVLHIEDSIREFELECFTECSRMGGGDRWNRIPF